jgi:hypothetical protein
MIAPLLSRQKTERKLADGKILERPISAQYFETPTFTDNYFKGYEINPALREKVIQI